MPFRNLFKRFSGRLKRDVSRMELANSKTPYIVINIQERYERERLCLTTDSDDGSISSEDSWKSTEQYWDDFVIEETLRKVPWGEFAISLMPTIQDDALQRALQECLTLDETDYNSCRFSLPMFATEYITKYLQVHLRTGSNKQESYDFMDFIVKEADTRSSKLKLLPGWPNMGLLIFSWLGHVDIAMALLDKGVPTTTRDNDGRTSAACAASVKIVEELRKRGANSRKWDIEKKYTPLHCAAAVGCVVTMKYLIQSGADVDAGLPDSSPLHYAVFNNAADCVEALLQADACVNNPQIYTEKLLHVAVEQFNVRCTKVLLKHGADVSVQLRATCSTPLHLAVEKGEVEYIRFLLSVGVALEMKDRYGRTAMHLIKSVETLDMLITAGALINAEDNSGRTLLHCIAMASGDSVCKKFAKALIEADAASVNKADKSGYTPLHIAAENENSRMVMMLLSKGADVTARTKTGITALKFIVRGTPQVLPHFVARFDHAISLRKDSELGSVDRELTLNFLPLMPNGRGKSNLMFCLVEAGLDHVLKHPMCKSFLHIKWLSIRKYFLLSLIFHSIFVALFTSYVSTTYLMNVNLLSDILLWPVMSFTCVLVGKEILQITHDICTYVRRWENWLQWSVILASSAIVISPGHTWQYHVAALGILLVWVELMMMIGRFPMFGIYIQMFTQVSISFFKLLAAYICLIIGFSLSFCVLHKNYKSFENPLVSLLKTAIMMSGELEFEDIYFEKKVKKDVEDIEESVLYPGTAHLMLLSFVILVTVILTNLMVGLAVSDIQELRRCADFDRLVRSTELMAHYESMLFCNSACILLFKLLYSIPCVNRILKAWWHDLQYPEELRIGILNYSHEKRLPCKLIKTLHCLANDEKSWPPRMTFRDGFFVPPSPMTLLRKKYLDK